MAHAQFRDDEALMNIFEGLSQIEAILKAESKRRVEANQITHDYINSYLDKLDTQLQNRVQNQFQAIEQRISTVNQTFSSVEAEFKKQESQVNELLATKSDMANQKLSDADLLLKNVKQTQLLQAQKGHSK